MERSGESEYLPGTLPVILGESLPGRFRQSVQIPGVEVLAGEASEVSGQGLLVDGRPVQADYVIAAPGLETELIIEGPGVYAFWSPSGAEGSADDAGRGAARCTR